MWDQEVLVKDDAAVLPDGTIAGSVLTLDAALQKLVSKVRLPLGDVLTMMTINPARVVKVDKLIGSIERTKSADLIALDDDLKVVKVLVNGKILR